MKLASKAQQDPWDFKVNAAYPALKANEERKATLVRPARMVPLDPWDFKVNQASPVLKETQERKGTLVKPAR